MAEENAPATITIKAQLIDEVTPKAQEMQSNFDASINTMAQVAQGFSESLQGIGLSIPGADTAAAALQEFAQGTLTVSDSLGILKDMARETGDNYVMLGVQAAESLAGVLGITEESIGGLGEMFSAFKEDSVGKSLEFAGAVADIGMSFVKEAKSQVEQQRKSDIEKVKNSTMSEEQKQKEIEKINKKADEEKKKLAEKEKAIAIVEAIINTGLAVTKALASSPPPLSFVLAGLAAAAGAVQVGIIASQQFAQGGIVAGTSLTGDTVPVRVNSGEMILTGAQQARLFAMANGGAGGNTITMGNETIIINGNADETAIEEIRKSRQQQIEDMRDLLREMKYNGQLEL